MSDYQDWKQLIHSEKWLLFPENIGKRISIDEVALSQGELYTVVTNKSAKGRKGAIIAIIEGTRSEIVIEHLLKIPYNIRKQVEEITLDMAGSMKAIATKCFTKAVQVVDRFHVQKLCVEAVQEIRIKHRWEVLEQENEKIKQAKQNKKSYQEQVLENGDSLRQLLARSRYILYKSRNNWTQTQKQRAQILFKLFPDLENAYKLSEKLKFIYNSKVKKEIAITKLAHWYKDVEESGLNSFNTIKNTIQLNYLAIINYFENRSTNASAESFNAKIKAFRAQFRGVKSKSFFLYRLTKIYA
jgi:transposase